MTTALDGAQRTALERVVTRARRLLEDDLLERASGRFGIDLDGTLADEQDLRLDPSALARRRELVDVVDHIRSEGEDPAGAVSRLLREATFTHLNRLVAIRIAEALGLLPPSIADGRASQGFRDLLELVPSLAGDDTGGYWTYLSLCGDELAGDVPALFDPRNPLLALAPSPGALDDVVELLAAPDAADLWLATDCLGWVYQFFNTGDERRAMREASAAPRDSRELAVRNQFFTPRYVVDFLVQNSLGRRLIDADPTSPLLDELPLLIDPATEAGEPVDLDDVSMLDPACGSGHFLLAGYDVLERAWHHAGVDAAEAAPAIVHSLWGIDIDPRCAQVAAAAVIFRARRSCPDGELPRPNIICARALPATSTGLDEVLSALPERHRRLVEAITDAMTDAPILGSLLKIEERLATEVRAAAFGGASGPGSLADELPADSLQALEDELLAALGSVADTTTASPAERLLAAEADDAIRFVHALQRRHDAVCMNPPFGEAVASTKEYLKGAYPWIPTRDYNLLAAFVGRGIELCKPAGYLGAITSRAGMFLKTFEAWREQVLLGHHLVALADLGFGVMEQALVEAAAYVIGSTTARSDDKAIFMRMLKDVDRSRALQATVAAHRAGRADDRLFEVMLDDLRVVPGSPVAYSMSPSLRRLFSEEPRLEGNGAEVRVGLQTGDDFRFVRAFWEVPPEQIGVSRADTLAGRRWVPFAKGGEYSPFRSDVHLLVDWANDGADIRSFKGSVVRNPQFYFRQGVTWPVRTNSAFAPQALPPGAIFSNRGNVCAPLSERDQLLLLAWLNSRFVRYVVETLAPSAEETRTGGVPSREYTAGMVQGIPWPRGLATVRAAMDPIMEELIETVRGAQPANEATFEFTSPRLLRADGTFDELLRLDEAERTRNAISALRLVAELERHIIEAIGASRDDLDMLDETLGPRVATLSRDPLSLEEAAEVEAAWARPMPDLIAEVVKRIGAVRYVNLNYHLVDRRVETICWGWSRHPDVVVQHKPPTLPWSGSTSGADVVSYVFGAAVGRWDVKYAQDRADWAWSRSEPLPVAPPGMLRDRPNRSQGRQQQDYPIQLPPNGLLLDEPGSTWDLEPRLLAAASAIRENGEAVLADSVRALGRSDLRAYLRKDFFKAHLARYSKSRRKAPIYWPLYVPSGSWGVWAHAPELTRETLFAIAGLAGERLDHAEAEIRRLLREREAGGAGRSDQAVANALEAEEHLSEELRRFRDEAERIAGLGWEPDLDDGIVLCAAPLADLFPAWRDAGTARKEIKAGKYPWATVSKWADQL